MKLDDVKKLHQKKYRSQLGYYLVEGEHLILELQKAALSQKDLNNITLYVTEDYQDWAAALQFDFTLVVVTTKQMAQLSNTKSPQGIIACVPLPNAAECEQSTSKAKLCIYLHEVQDPGNLGTILRSLAWFGNFKLLLSANSVDPYNPKVVRASMGAIFHVPIELDVELDALQKRFTKFAYLDMQGKPINTAEFSQYDCYLFGNEARGVPREALTQCDADAFTIPGNGTIDSLNLASAVNMCVYQLSV
ncbi:RNA methyltransferase [uncultured Paraglaciecola sp.]|uniref:TrmH family RNA methyltransferase n=1 Tax=uncultured Paraglaciecola sp. TaxID=1765024 RepID=UPI00259429FC|nr:RNA methyltransferase [uncultured Paraglaciecola sp.]